MSAPGHRDCTLRIDTLGLLIDQRRLGALLLASTFLLPSPLAAECFYFGRETIPVEGALCGTAFLSDGGVVNDSELLLRSASGHVITAKTDSKGGFTFGPLEAGEYRLALPGARETGTTLAVTASGTRCEHRLRVVFEVGECPSSVSTGAGVRLRVDSKTPAQVIVDGDEEGDAGDFNTGYDLIELFPGTHHVEVRAPGYASHSFDVRIGDYDVVTHRARLRAVKP